MALPLWVGKTIEYCPVPLYLLILAFCRSWEPARSNDILISMESIRVPTPQQINLPTVRASEPCYQDLPQHVVESIVQHIRNSITTDGYLCDLRLVNRQTNEAVLHCLVFRGTLYRFRPEHYMSCVDPCRRKLCRDVGVSNEYYSRYYLQGRIALQYDKDADRRKYYEILGQALVILKHDLALPSNSFAVVRSYLEDSTKAACTSRNPLFADKASIMLCDMIIEYTKMLHSRGTHAPWLKHNVHPQRSIGFWLRSLACYLGDINLLKHYSVSDKSAGSAFVHDPVELGELLGIAACRGHEVVFEHLFVYASEDNTDLKFALCGSCQSASIGIAQTILEAVPPTKLSDLCLESLLRLRESQRMKSGYSQVAQLLLDQLDPTIQDERRLSVVTWVQASLDATVQVRYMLDRYSSLLVWPLIRVREPSFSALWSACVNGNIECVQILLSDERFRSRARVESSKAICSGCCPVAIRSNSLVIHEMLLAFTGETASFKDLAGMDGSVSLMTRRLESEPQLLETPVEHRQPQPQIGQMALLHAATLLRVANVRFLLQQGVRLDEAHLRDYDSSWSGPPAFHIEWRYRRAHELKYQQVQTLLHDCGVRGLSVEM